MGKKSLIKSTSKKKSETKKDAKGTQKTAAKKAKKAPSKAAKKSTKAKTADAKAGAKTKAPSKKPSVKELVFRKFEPLQLAQKKIAPPEPPAAKLTAPPLITATDEKEVKRLQGLLAKKFSMAEVKAAAKAPQPQVKKTKPIRKKLSIKELTFLKFEALQPDTKKLAPPEPAPSKLTAPPLITATDEKEVKRLQGLLAKKFSMAEVKAAAKAPQPQVKKTKPVRKKLSIKELTFLKFEALQPDAKKLAPPEPAPAKLTAPPLITATDEKEVKRLQGLLAKKFSMAEVKAAAKAPQPQAEKPKPVRKKLSIKELTFLKFEALQPDAKKLAPPEPAPAKLTAPPLITATDEKEVKRLQGLLAKKFSMTEIKAAAKAPQPKPAAPAAATPKVQEAKAAQKADMQPKEIPKDKPERKKLSRHELIFQKFTPIQPLTSKLAAPKPTAAQLTAPPLITATDPKEIERIQLLLKKKFSMAEIKASAKAPEPQPAVSPPSEAPVKETRIETMTETKSKPAVPASTIPQTPPQNAAYVTFDKPKGKKQKTADPVSFSVKLGIGAAVFVIILLLGMSFSNSSKYYLKPIKGGIEIWKGDFSPKDQSILITLEGSELSEPVKAVYSKKEIYPFIFDYYMEKSDNLLEVEGLPDFEDIKSYLNDAKKYAVTNEMENAIVDRLNTIDRMVLLYKADVAMSKNTKDSLELAIKLLKNAAKLTPTALQSDEISQKIETARQKISELEAAAQISETATEPETEPNENQNEEQVEPEIESDTSNSQEANESESGTEINDTNHPKENSDTHK